MFSEMAARQAEVVEALLGSIAVADWTHAYLHAEFRDEDGALAQYKHGFLAIEGENGLERAPLAIESEVGTALATMHATYVQANQEFSRLDLIADSDGRYRFELDDRPSLILAGEADPEAKGRLERRFADLVRERNA